MSQNVNTMPKVGNMVLSVGEQQPVDFSLLLNMQARNGVLEPRPGWRILERTLTYSAVADPAAPDGLSWVETTTEQARWPDNQPLGAFCFDSTDGQSLILSIWYEGGDYNTFRVTSTCGETKTFGQLFPVLYTGAGRSTVEPQESVNDPYCFARYYDTVFFTNGGALWRWQPLISLTPYLCEAFHNNQYANLGVYVTGTIRGVRSICVHQGSLVLGGFERETIVSLDGPIDTNGDGLVTSADATQVGGFTVAAGVSGVFVDPYTFMISDPEMPLCFSTDRITQLGSHLGITAVASANERLVIWTSGETFQVLGPAADPLASTIQLISRGIGCVGPRAVAQTDAGWLMWLSDTGVFAWGEGGPKKISDEINDLFDKGLSPFWRWQTVADSTSDYPRVSGLPTMALTSAGPIASAVWLDRYDTLCIAVSGACTHEPNSLIIAWTPKDNRFAVWTAQSATANWTLVGVQPNAYWSPLAPTLRAAMVGAYTLMTSANEPGLLLAQAQANDSAIPWVSPIGSLCVMNSETTDQSADGTGRADFLALAISAPVFLGDDDTKTMRRVFVRMYAQRIRDYLTKFGETADQNPPWFFLIPETGHFDVATDAQTETVSSAQAFSPWQDGFTDRLYFWQSLNAPDATKGAWGNVPGFASRQRKWLPMSVVDKRFDVPQRVGRWFRFAVGKIVDGFSDPGISLVSAGVEIQPGAGVRR